MLKHINAHHGNDKDKVDFRWKVIRKFNKPLQRQLFEANQINYQPENVILNSKSEFNSVNLKKLTIKRKTFQCNECSMKFDDDASLAKHRNDMHSKIKCENCDYTSIGKIDMKYHNKYQHNIQP